MNNRLNRYYTDIRVGNFRLKVLFSGSAGNCSYIKWDNGENREDIIIDFGAKNMTIMKELARINKEHEDTKYTLLLSHEHTDHFNPSSILRAQYIDKKLKRIVGTAQQSDKLWDTIEQVKYMSEEDREINRRKDKYFHKLEAQAKLVSEYDFNNYGVHKISHDEVTSTDFTDTFPTRARHDDLTIYCIPTDHTDQSFGFVIVENATKEALVYLTDIPERSLAPIEEFIHDNEIMPVIVAVENAYDYDRMAVQTKANGNDVAKYAEMYKDHLQSRETHAFLKKMFKLNSELQYELLHESRSSLELEEEIAPFGVEQQRDR